MAFVGRVGGVSAAAGSAAVGSASTAGEGSSAEAKREEENLLVRVASPDSQVAPAMRVTTVSWVMSALVDLEQKEKAAVETAAV